MSKMEKKNLIRRTKKIVICSYKKQNFKKLKNFYKSLIFSVKIKIIKNLKFFFKVEYCFNAYIVIKICENF